MDEEYLQGRSLCMYSVIYLLNFSFSDGTDPINQVTKKEFCFTELLFIISFSHVEITENDWRVYGCDNSTISEVLRHISHVTLFAIIDEVIAFLIWFRKSTKSRPDYPINRIQVQNLISILFVHSPYSACYCLSNTTQNFFVFC